MAFYKYTPKTNGDRYSICKTLFGCQTYFYKCVGYCQKKGKYLTAKQLKNKECLKKAEKSKGLERSLKMAISSDVYESLEKEVDQLEHE